MPGSDRLDLVPTTGNVRNALDGRSTNQHLRGQAMGASESQRFFHWPLEFPDVFQHGGFDVVLGNPPWERIKLQEKEFFLTRDREIATAPNKAARQRLIQALPQHNPALAKEFSQAVHNSESTKFGSCAAVNGFHLTGRRQMSTPIPSSRRRRGPSARPTGRVGIIVPSGHRHRRYNQGLFHRPREQSVHWSAFTTFENREGVFPGVHRSYKFCLLTLTGADRPSPQRRNLPFFLYRSEQLQER